MQSVRNWSKTSVLAPHEYFSLSGFQLGTRYKFFLSCLFLWESPQSFQLFFFLLLVSSLKTFFYFAFLFKPHWHRADKWPAQEIKVIAAAWWTVREQLCTFKTRKNKVQHFFCVCFLNTGRRQLRSWWWKQSQSKEQKHLDRPLSA